MLPLAACTFNISLSSITKGSVITCSFSLADKLTKLSKTKAVPAALVNVTLAVAAPAASSANKID